MSQNQTPARGEVGFYKPDPGWNKSPDIVLGIEGDKLRVLELPTMMVFQIDSADWMNMDEMRASTTALEQGVAYPNMDADMRAHLVRGRYEAIKSAEVYLAVQNIDLDEIDNPDTTEGEAPSP